MFFVDRKHPLVYAISDRLALNNESLPSFAERASRAGIDMLQIREKDLDDRPLCELVKECVARSSGSNMRILVNDRLDIAVAAGAHGVHLGGHSVDATAVRAVAPPEFIIGVSTHNATEIQKAVDGGADFITFGPVFFTASKAKYGPPVGIDALKSVLNTYKIPTIPLGGITPENLQSVLSLPVKGVASISLFQNADNLATIVETIHKGSEHQ